MSQNPFRGKCNRRSSHYRTGHPTSNGYGQTGARRFAVWNLLKIWQIYSRKVALAVRIEEVNYWLYLKLSLFLVTLIFDLPLVFWLDNKTYGLLLHSFGNETSKSQYIATWNGSKEQHCDWSINYGAPYGGLYKRQPKRALGQKAAFTLRAPKWRRNPQRIPKKILQTRPLSMTIRDSLTVAFQKDNHCSQIKRLFSLEHYFFRLKKQRRRYLRKGGWQCFNHSYEILQLVLLLKLIGWKYAARVILARHFCNTKPKFLRNCY